MINTERIISTTIQKEDYGLENVLRPKTFNDYVGQEKLKNSIKVYIEAAQNRGEPLDHVLLYGPPGLGKTTLSNIIAYEMGVNIKTTSGPAIAKAGELAAILRTLKTGDVLFIDEIHRLDRSVEEILYPAMEDFSLDVMIGSESASRSVRINLPKFTLIGATTRAGLLTAPLRDRFGIVSHLEFYNPKELSTIILASAERLGIKTDEEGAMEMARRSRGTPRLANRLLKRVRDYAEVKFDGIITKDVACYALDVLEVDKMGLDQNDRDIILTIIEKFGGGPVGLDTLAASIGEDAGTIEDVYEPYLVMNGFINRTPRGREATSLSYEHFGLSK
ncbi:MAG: Holliday junction branch migration DNA helicase RuvB [Eubacterium sp.]|nr:Holliday junction branch migration DNA helicase RuvB [Eubacterium sp.]